MKAGDGETGGRGDWEIKKDDRTLNQQRQRVLQAEGTSMMEPEDEFYGDRNAGVKDPTGNHWWIATHQEDVSSEEMEKRMKDLFGSKEKL